jgi:hypothetical protein
VNLDEFLHERQTDAGALVRPTFGAFDPMKALK